MKSIYKSFGASILVQLIIVDCACLLCVTDWWIRLTPTALVHVVTRRTLVIVQDIFIHTYTPHPPYPPPYPPQCTIVTTVMSECSVFCTTRFSIIKFKTVVARLITFKINVATVAKIPFCQIYVYLTNLCKKYYILPLPSPIYNIQWLNIFFKYKINIAPCECGQRCPSRFRIYSGLFVSTPASFEWISDKKN